MLVNAHPPHGRVMAAARLMFAVGGDAEDEHAEGLAQV